jgi:hypothetical protein
MERKSQIDHVRNLLYDGARIPRDVDLRATFFQGLWNQYERRSKYGESM